MAHQSLPQYLNAANPNPVENRAPWFKNTAPAYAGIFLSVPFMAGMAGALAFASIAAAAYFVLAGLGLQSETLELSSK